MFKDLRVVGLGTAASYQSTFGSFFNPKVILENIRTMRHPPLRDILSGFEGVIRPGEMLRMYYLLLSWVGHDFSINLSRARQPRLGMQHVAENAH
jgi:hypothetical protein